MRVYEDASAAIGRLDATAKLVPVGLRRLLILRATVTPLGASRRGMIALVRPDGEGAESYAEYAAYQRALTQGSARARGGALPSMASLHELLDLPITSEWSASGIDELLRDAHERTPPVLKAALAALAIHGETGDETDVSPTRRLAALATTLLLCVGGATTDAWLTLPHAGTTPDHSLRGMFTVLAREARAAERGIEAAQALCDADEARVRESLGRAAYSALDMLALLREEIAITVPDAARALDQTPPTAGAAVARLVELGIAHEITGKARLRVFAYDGMVRALAPSE